MIARTHIPSSFNIVPNVFVPGGLVATFEGSMLTSIASRKAFIMQDNKIAELLIE